jgi:hypothetical protein
MLQPDTLASSESFAMLAAVILGVGFMARFLVALISEGKKSRVGEPVRAKEPYATEAAREPRHYNLALGVFRITTALASTHSRDRRPAADRSRVMFAARGSATKRLYRWI